MIFHAGRPLQLSRCLARQPLRTNSFELIAIKAQLELKHEASMCATTTVLSPTLHSPEVTEFEAALRSRIIGQQEGLQALVDLYQVLCAGLNSPGRPLGSLLFLGPTGTGKTRLVEAAAEILFGKPARHDQSRLWRVPAFPRNCQVSWLAARISGPPRDTSGPHARGPGAISQRKAGP